MQQLRRLLPRQSVPKGHGQKLAYGARVAHAEGEAHAAPTPLIDFQLISMIGIGSFFIRKLQASLLYAEKRVKAFVADAVCVRDKRGYPVIQLLRQKQGLFVFSVYADIGGGIKRAHQSALLVDWLATELLRVGVDQQACHFLE